MSFSASECLKFLEQFDPKKIDAALVDGKTAEDREAMFGSNKTAQQRYKNLGCNK